MSQTEQVKHGSKWKYRPSCCASKLQDSGSRKLKAPPPTWWLTVWSQHGTVWQCPYCLKCNKEKDRKLLHLLGVLLWGNDFTFPEPQFLHLENSSDKCCLQNCQAPHMGYVRITQHSVLHIGDIQQITVVTRVQFKNIITAFTHRTLLQSL